MQVLNVEQIRAWDQYTIEQTPISSIDLMEKAAMAFCEQFEKWNTDKSNSIQIFCGPGNNGGDGLAVARILHFRSYEIEVVLCNISHQTSSDFQKNLKRLPQYDTINIIELNAGDDLNNLSKHPIIIDAIFGSGLNRPIVNYWANLIDWINQNAVKIIAIDVPSGLQCDQIIQGNTVKADETISFQVPKLAYFFAENASYVGRWKVVDIGLHSAYLEQIDSSFIYQERESLTSLFQSRKAFDHKGNHGHALLIAGSYGMLGAAQLTAKAAVRSGAGLVSIHVPKCGYEIIQTSVPEAMLSIDKDTEVFSQIKLQKDYQAIGIGPGLGKNTSTQIALKKLLKQSEHPMVIDADALNILALHPKLFKKVPKDSILTPHPGEFRRLFGKSADSKEELMLLQEKAKELGVIIVLKGAYTRIASSSGNIYFNSTGNPGMATGGSGDVLTGLLTGLLAQSYSPLEAARLGVWLHGKAGDLAATKNHPVAMCASDIINQIGNAMQVLKT